MKEQMHKTPLVSLNSDTKHLVVAIITPGLRTVGFKEGGASKEGDASSFGAKKELWLTRCWISELRAILVCGISPRAGTEKITANRHQ
ncbi:MAG: hypothetical protein ACR5K7_05120 [Symbiopectobacterium sp.]